ncbi:hypothetical protein DJ533_06360 [Acinetobacter defluvii]|uniref:Uncharacterized protein n=2 Tax=Acinetobacter defluvii TaxID=1871111 RepID=A0A2S2FB73_9GAMM|nr:hypothetical protein DJ533_06360 [Acinetobacter defluvii]
MKIQQEIFDPKSPTDKQLKIDETITSAIHHNSQTIFTQQNIQGASDSLVGLVSDDTSLLEEPHIDDNHPVMQSEVEHNSTHISESIQRTEPSESRAANVQLEALTHENDIEAKLENSHSVQNRLQTDEDLLNLNAAVKLDLNQEIAQHLPFEENKTLDLISSVKTITSLEKIQPDDLQAKKQADDELTDRQIQQAEAEILKKMSSFKENSMYLNLKTQILYGKWKPIKEKKERKIHINPFYIVTGIVLVLGTNVSYLAYQKYQKYQQEQDIKLELYKIEQEKKNAAQKNAALRK